MTSATVTFTAIGSCIVDANQSGELPAYAAAPQVQQDMTVIGLPQAITFTSTVPTNAVYGGSYTPTATGGASGNPVTFSTTSPTVCTVASGVVSLVGVGTCVVDADQAGTTTYSAAPEVSQSFTVSPALLTVTPANESKPYGAADPQFAFTISGFQNKDTAAAVSSQPVCTVSATHTSVGTYAITCGGATATNYTFTYNTATLTVNRAPLTVTANSITRQYGVANPTLGATISGFVYGQNLSSSGVTGAPACTTTATTTSAPGVYPITCTEGTLSSANYAFTTFTAGSLTVVRAATTLVAARPTFGLLTINFSATLTGTVTGAPIQSQVVTFSIAGNKVCSAFTNSKGVATCTAIGLVLGPVVYTATYAGSADYVSSTSSATF